MSSTSIQELATIVSRNTTTYNNYLLANGLPTPSHHDCPPEVATQLPPEIELSRQAALEASHELHDLLCAPAGHIMNAAMRSTRIMVLNFIHTYKIGYNLIWGERTTFAKVAEKCKLDEDDVKRMLRLAMTEHFFDEPENGVVVHTAASFELARNHRLSAWVGVMTKENWSPMLKVSETFKTYPGSEEPMESAYAMAHELKEDAFAVWEKDPARIEQFSDAMAFLHSDSGFQPAAVLSTTNPQITGRPKFVDVGGSIGHVSIPLAREYPGWDFIVQDSYATVTRGEEMVPADVKGQVSFQVHDFWTPQPVCADVYFFKTIFHDWSDKYSVKILRQLIPALKPGAKIIIADVCIPPKGVISSYKEHWVRGLDLVMKCFTNAKERSTEDWIALFAKADIRFRFSGVRTPLGSKASLIEAQWIPDVGGDIGSASSSDSGLETMDGQP